MISTRAGERTGRTVLRCQSCGLEKERAASLADLDEFWPEVAAKVRAETGNDRGRSEMAAAKIATHHVGGSRGKTKE